MLMLTRKKFRYNVALPEKPYTKIKEAQSLRYFEMINPRVLNNIVNPSLEIARFYLEELKKLRKSISFWHPKLRAEIDSFIWCFNYFETCLEWYSNTIDEMREGTSGYNITEIDNMINDTILDITNDMIIEVKLFEEFKSKLKGWK